MRNIIISVFTHINKKVLLNVLAIAQRLSIFFPIFNRMGIKSALTLLMFMIDLIPDQIFFILFLLHRK